MWMKTKLQKVKSACTHKHAYACVCVCVCVCEGEDDKQKYQQIESARLLAKKDIRT